MANINDVFDKYDESKPMVSFNLPPKEELIAELLGLIPGGRALKNFHDNPEGTASETLSLAAEDVVPLYGAIKNGASAEDIAKEAALLTIPLPTGLSKANSIKDFTKLYPENTFKKESIRKAKELEADFNKAVNNRLDRRTYTKLKQEFERNPEAFQILRGKRSFNQQFEKVADKLITRHKDFDKLTPEQKLGYTLFETNRIADEMMAKGANKLNAAGQPLGTRIDGIEIPDEYKLKSEKYLTDDEALGLTKAEEEARNAADGLLMGKGAEFDVNPFGPLAKNMENLLDANPKFDFRNYDKPIEMVQVEDFGNGILHNEGPAAAPQGGRRNTYDHSRQFMDTELKQVPPIDRTGMIYGDNTDAMYDIYKAWRDSKPNDRLNQMLGYDAAGQKAIEKLNNEVKRSKDPSKTAIIMTDPYYAAGVIGDSNVRLWNKIDALKAEGKTDREIREILKDDLNKYQGQIERFKERMPSKGHGSQFEYDGASTNTLKALPSEEARALKALGIDTPEYDQLERLGNIYRVFFPK